MSDKGLLIARRAFCHQGMGKARATALRANHHPSADHGASWGPEVTLGGSHLGVAPEGNGGRGAESQRCVCIYAPLCLVNLIRKNTLSEPNTLPGARFITSQDGSLSWQRGAGGSYHLRSPALLVISNCCRLHAGQWEMHWAGGDCGYRLV